MQQDRLERPGRAQTSDTTAAFTTPTLSRRRLAPTSIPNGASGRFQGTTGDWREFDFDAVIATLYALTGRENLNPEADLAIKASALLEATKPQVVSVLRAWLTHHEDALVAELSEEASRVEPMSERTAQTALVGQIGTKMTRDTTALSQGWQAAPHQVVEARAISIRSSFQKGCEKLAELASAPPTTSPGLSSLKLQEARRQSLPAKTFSLATAAPAPGAS